MLVVLGFSVQLLEKSFESFEGIFCFRIYILFHLW